MRDLVDEGASHTLARKIMVSLRSILSEAVEPELAEHNVAVDVKVKRRSRTGTPDKVIPTKKELHLIIDNAPASHRAMFVTAIFTGMRVSELRGLVWDAVDFDRQVIQVRQRTDE